MKHYNTTSAGYLIDFYTWDKNYAKLSSEIENITLTDEHWEIICFLRDFYEKYQISPAIRALVKAMKLSFPQEKANSLYLQILFPVSPALQSAKISGLPKPARCI